MKIKGFNDGGTFVLTFDGADQNFINKLIGSFKPEMLEPVDAEPIITEIADPNENKSTAEPVLTPENRIFEKGPLKGMTTVQALGQLKDGAFRILSFYVSSGKLPKDMHKYCASCLNDQVAYRFEDYVGWTGPDVFKHVVENFTDEKVNEFIELFTPLITADMWKAVKSAPEEVTKLNEKQRKTLVALIILRGAKLSQKQRMPSNKKRNKRSWEHKFLGIFYFVKKKLTYKQ